MAADDDNLRRPSFSQVHGLAEMPTQLVHKQLSRELRAHLWRVIYPSMLSCRTVKVQRYVLTGRWMTLLIDYHVEVNHAFVDDVTNGFEKNIEFVKELIQKGPYNKIFDFLQFFLRKAYLFDDLREDIEYVLIDCRSAYRLVDGDTIVPLGSEQEMATVVKAFSDLQATEFNGARAHLKSAAHALTSGNFSDSIRESIHAVDGVARSLAPSARDLAPALSALRDKGYIHPAMRDGFAKLYGYTSDEKGVRHALIEDANSKVTETDAIYMLGSCAAFVSYLIGKSREFGIATV